ncbi:hypothetical protein DPMN_066820 [Dreissena polymorpha]|uniref:Myosin heavy chain n=1 Tax=Dreissena polymorpha TaxID=45954 RepID=A0A9D3YZQ3_DREPO|nr:hypothetical protein DPMN_066820 [Dreissena polymorpha]
MRVYPESFHFYRPTLEAISWPKQCKKLKDQRTALAMIQRNIRKWMVLRNWQWWKLYTKVKSLLNAARAEDEVKKAEEEFAKSKEELAKVEKIKKELEERCVKLQREKEDAVLQLAAEGDTLGDMEETIENLTKQKFEYEAQIKEMESRMTEEEGNAGKLSAQKQELEALAAERNENITGLEYSLSTTVRYNHQGILYNETAFKFELQ